MLRLLLSMVQARSSDVGFWGVKQTLGQSAGNDALDPNPDMSLRRSATQHVAEECCGLAIADRLRVILDAAVKRIGGPNLPPIRSNHQPISL